MAEQDESKSLTSPIAGLAVVAAILGVWIITPSPMKSARPETPRAEMVSTFELQDIPARLWEDPLAAIRRAHEGEGSTTPAAGVPRLPRHSTLQSLADDIKRRLPSSPLPVTQQEAGQPQSTAAALTIMPVMIEGGWHAEQVQERLRQRYAVHSALGVRGYSPENAESIGSFSTCWVEEGLVKEAAAPCGNGVLLEVPFEWFRNDSREVDTPSRSATSWRAGAFVLVLWFDESRVWADRGESDHLMTVGWLVQQLIGDDELRSGRVQVKLIGPATTTTLQQMFLRAAARASGPNEPDKQHVAVATFANLLVETLDGYLDAGLPSHVDQRSLAVDVETQIRQPLTNRSPAMLGMNPLALSQLADFIRQRPGFENIKDSDEDWLIHSLQLWDMLVMAAAESGQVTSTAPPLETLRNFEIYSTRVTANLQRLLHLDQEPPREEEDPFSYPRLADSLGVGKFDSLIADDYSVAEALVQELELRRVRPLVPSQSDAGVPEAGRDHVAFVGEWDTLYARELPRLIRNAWASRWGAHRAEALRNFDKNAHYFRYLRGLDGEVAGSKKDQAKQAGNGNENAKAAFSERELFAALETPEGTSQLDAVRRLTGRLRALETTFANGERLRAIGVVGSDVYDKELVLQALKGAFPGVIFFTTDLDARLMHPSQFPWTRNLIVGSSFGLELSEPRQRWVPPFRNCYQTSTFLGCLVALDNLRDDNGSRTNARALRDALDSPRVFEIGRGEVFDLATWHDVSSVLHPAPGWIVNGESRFWRFGFSVLALLVLVFGWALRSAHRDPQSTGSTGALLGAGALFLAATVVFLAILRLDVTEGRGEPLVLLGGVSVWPSEAIRLLASALSVAFLINGARRLRHSEEELTKRYGLLKTDSGAGTPKCSVQSCVRRFPKGSLPFFWAPRLQGEGNTRPVDARVVWEAYRELTRCGCRWVRVVLLAAVLFCLIRFLALPLTQSGFPSPPVRGDLAWLADRVVLVLSVGSTCVLALFVLDATRVCRWLVELFEKHQVEWPQASRTIAQEEFGLQGAAADEFIEIRFLSELTQPVSRMVVYPSIAIFLLLVARGGYFDDWAWSAPLVVAFGLLLACVVGAAVMGRVSAERERRESVASLRRMQACTLGGSSEKADQHARHLGLAVDYIEGVRTGAFSPWSTSPILRAVLLPFGGAGVAYLLDLFSKLGM